MGVEYEFLSDLCAGDRGEFWFRVDAGANVFASVPCERLTGDTFVLLKLVGFNVGLIASSL